MSPVSHVRVHVGAPTECCGGEEKGLLLVHCNAKHDVVSGHSHTGEAVRLKAEGNQTRATVLTHER